MPPKGRARRKPSVPLMHPLNGDFNTGAQGWQMPGREGRGSARENSKNQTPSPNEAKPRGQASPPRNGNFEDTPSLMLFTDEPSADRHAGRQKPGHVRAQRPGGSAGRVVGKAIQVATHRDPASPFASITKVN
jgi:hypothetical protein